MLSRRNLKSGDRSDWFNMKKAFMLRESSDFLKAMTEASDTFQISQSHLAVVLWDTHRTVGFKTFLIFFRGKSYS